MNVIEVKNITKTYGRTRALSDVSLTIEENKIYGLLGRNGAGKTTLLNVITNKLFADSGSVLVYGEPAIENDAAQGKLFYTTDSKVYPEDNRVSDIIEWTKAFYPNFKDSYAEDLIKKFSLNVKKRVKGLSTGYVSVLRNILTLASGAPVLIFDEPVLGLDANFRELFYKELLSLYSEHPCTILISTHLIDEVSDILEEVFIIKGGKLILAQPVEKVLELAYTVSGESGAVDAYVAGKNVLRSEMIGRYKAATIYQKRGEADAAELRRQGLEITQAKLQELFVSLTNEGGN